MARTSCTLLRPENRRDVLRESVQREGRERQEGELLDEAQAQFRDCTAICFAMLAPLSFDAKCILAALNNLLGLDAFPL